MADREVLPELWCDFNGRVMSGSYWLGAQATLDQLAMLCTIEHEPGLGCFVARVDNDFYWRPKLVDR